MTHPDAPITPEEVRHQALTLGFDDVGITDAHIPDEDIAAFRHWLAEQRHGELAYMENATRLDLQEWFPGAKTALIFVSYYKQEHTPFAKDAGVVASYARGRDYHNVHRKRLKKMRTWLEERSGEKEVAKPFSDSSPVMEKVLAVRAGLGWLGKNTLLIHRKFGTFTLLAGMLTTLDIPGKNLDTRQERCGSCSRCLDACPTQAFVGPYHLDATKCLSYHLIESKQDIPSDIQDKNPGCIFGCDVCQDVCPHNQRKPLATTHDFTANAGVGPTLTAQDIQHLNNTPETLHGTPLQRRKTPGLTHTAQTLGWEVKS